MNLNLKLARESMPSPIFKLEQTNLNGWRLKVYIVQGDQPFNSIMVTDLHDGATRTIEGHDKILDWLSFRMD